MSHLISIPSYRDIFKQEAPEVKTLIEDIPSKVIISFLSAINGQLLLKHNDKNVQIDIFLIWSKRFTQIQKNLILKNINLFIHNSKSKERGFPILFAERYILEFLEHELLNHREFAIEDTTPEQEYRLFQAYMIVLEKSNDKYNILFEKPRHTKEIKFPFQVVTWPFIIGQYELNNPIDPAYLSIRSMLMLNYLYRNEKTKEYVKKYLSIVNRPNLWQYVFDLLNLINTGYNQSIDSFFKTYSIASAPEYAAIFKEFTVDCNEYKNDEGLQKDFLGIKRKPLYLLENGRHVVMDWRFVQNKLYTGILFDFYRRSGINEAFKLPDLKSEIGRNVSEGMFKSILSKALSKKHHVINFDDKKQRSIPDGYYRNGKYLFFFEFKDYSMPVHISHSMSYEEIKAHIDERFISNNDKKPKGIIQLLEHVKKINNGGFLFDQFEAKGIKKRNIVIYPIIVYTDYMYSLLGVNDYLNVTFREELEKYKSTTDFKVGHVKDVIMIDLQFLFEKFKLFENGQLNIKDLCEAYYSEIQKRQSKFNKTQNVDDRLHANMPFERVVYKFPIESRYSDENYIQELFDLFNIKPELNT